MMNFEQMVDPKSEAWDKQQGMMERIYSQGAEGFLRDVEGMGKAFETEKKCVCCIDEGTAHMDIKGKFEMAGSGILYPAASWEERLVKVANLLIDMGIEEVTSHDGCGAAGIAFKRHETDASTPKSLAIRWAQELQAEMLRQISERPADQLKKPASEYKVSSRHIEAGEMARHKDFHEARVVWFDGTGGFNPAALGKNVPLGFAIDYMHDTKNAITDEEKKYPFEELRIALEIAFVGHGLGDKFEEDNPFVVVVMAQDRVMMEQLTERVTKFKESLDIPEEQKRAIRIDGYSVQPAEELKVAA